jgi:hypothetical protein
MDYHIIVLAEYKNQIANIRIYTQTGLMRLSLSEYISDADLQNCLSIYIGTDMTNVIFEM